MRPAGQCDGRSGSAPGRRRFGRGWKVLRPRSLCGLVKWEHGGRCFPARVTPAVGRRALAMLWREEHGRVVGGRTSLAGLLGGGTSWFQTSTLSDQSVSFGFS